MTTTPRSKELWENCREQPVGQGGVLARWWAIAWVGLNNSFPEHQCLCNVAVYSGSLEEWDQVCFNRIEGRLEPVILLLWLLGSILLVG